MGGEHRSWLSERTENEEGRMQMRCRLKKIRAAALWGQGVGEAEGETGHNRKPIETIT